MESEERRPGESEVDFRYRIGQDKRAKEASRRIAALDKYEPATEQVARTIAESIQPLLEDMVGPATINVTLYRREGAIDKGMPPATTEAVATIIARSKAASHEADVRLWVNATMKGSDQAAELTYTLLGNLSYKTPTGQSSGATVKLSEAVAGRPTVDLDKLREDIRRQARF